MSDVGFGTIFVSLKTEEKQELWEERVIKFEQKYLFTPDFNKCGLQKTNGTYHRWVKLYF